MLQTLHTPRVFAPIHRKTAESERAETVTVRGTGGVTPGLRVPVGVPQFWPSKRFVVRDTTRGSEFICAAEAQSPNEAPTASTVIDYVLGRGNYQFFSGVVLVIAVAMIAAAPMVAEIIQQVSLLPVGEIIHRAAASLMILPAAVAWIMQSAVADNRLDSPTYKRLSFGLAITCAAMCGFKLYSMFQGQGFMTPGLGMTSVLQMLPTVAFFKLYGTSTLQDIIPGFISGITSLFQPENINSAIYALGSAAAMAYAVVAVVSPTTIASLMLTQSVDFLGQYMIRTLGLMHFLLSMSCFTLKDAADRGRLGFSTFRNLNIAVLLVSLAKIGNAFYMTQGTTAAATTAATTSTAVVETVASPVTRFHWIALLSLYGTLAVVSGFNAIMAKKE